ncbi:MAG: hypothetical protein FJX72_01490 [Armatimonadetes bacterium]|nr:hypothetical protein [Armatimonadota bacterium]
MTRRPDEVRHKLQTKFHFRQHSHRATDHVYIVRSLPGDRIVVTKFSRGTRDMSDGLIGAVARQLGVSRERFEQMIGCTVSEAEDVETARPPEPPR